MEDFLLGVAMASRIAVLNSGKIVETGDARSLYHEPQHPYTQLLLGRRSPFHFN